MCLTTVKQYLWNDPETGLIVPVAPIRCAEDVPTNNVGYGKFFKVLWESMLSQQTGKDKTGNDRKNWSIQGIFLLRSRVCERFLCSKVNATLSSEGIRFHVKPIQVLKTIRFGTLTCISNLIDLAGVLGTLKQLCIKI